jgi:hypothetical protein
MLGINIFQYVKQHLGQAATIVGSVTGGYLLALYRASLSGSLDLVRRSFAVAYSRLGLYPILLRRYKRSLVATHSRIRLGYRDFEIDIKRQYIKLRLRQGFVPAFQQAREEPQRRATTIEEFIKDREPADRNQPSLRLVVLGHPGSGKTTLLKHLVLVYAGDAVIPTRKKLIPILISLREARGLPIWTFILKTFEMHKFPAAHNFLVTMLQKGECLVLFDGLDELLDRDQTEALAEIKRLAVLYDRNIFIVTSRVEGYVRTSEILFEEAEIAPLDPSGLETREFVCGIIGSSDPDRFLEALRSDQNLRRLAESPLLLSLIVFIYVESQGHLPKNRTKIYKTFIQWMLRDRDKSKGIYEYRNKFDAEDKELFLRKLAYSVFLEGASDFSKKLLISKIGQLSQQLHLEKDVRPEDFLNEIAECNGLLRRTYGEQYSFLHLTFQEYYVAKEINEANRVTGAFEHIGDPNWTEVILFLVGLLDFQVAGQLIEHVLETTVDYAFAGRCLAHISTEIDGLAGRIIPELMQRLNEESARRALVEIGDSSVISHLVALLSDMSPVCPNRVLAEDCLNKLSSKAVLEAVLDRAKMFANQRRLGRSLMTLELFRPIVGNRLDSHIENIREMLSTALTESLGRYRTDGLPSGESIYGRKSEGSYGTDREDPIRAYEELAGLTTEFEALLSDVPRLQDGWNAVRSTITEEPLRRGNGEQREYLTRLRKAWDQMQFLCGEARVSPEAFRRKLTLLCDTQMMRESYRVDWIARRTVICP